MSHHTSSVVLPEHVLGRADVQTALYRRDFGAVFRLARKWGGISYGQIAAACDIKPERVGTLARGQGAVTSFEKITEIVDGLRVPGAMVGLALRPWERRTDRNQPAPRTCAVEAARTAPAQPVTNPTGSPDMAAVESFRLADSRLGGGNLYVSVLHYLHHSVAPRLFIGSDACEGDETFQAAASLTEMAGWMAHDSGRNDRARRHFASALRLSEAHDTPSLGANVLASKSHLALQSGRPGEAVSLAEAGRERGRRGPRLPMLTSKLRAMEARARAQLGETTRMRRVLDAAQEALAEEPDEAPLPWVSRFDGAALASEAALCLQNIGALSSAREEAQRAVDLRSGERARSRVFSQITLAAILTDQGELEAACSVGGGLLGACQSLGSMRVTEQLNDLAATMVLHRGQRLVAEFLDCLAGVTRQRSSLLAGLTVSPHDGGAFS